MDDLSDADLFRKDEVQHTVVTHPEAVQRRIVMGPERPDIGAGPGTKWVVLEDREPFSDPTVCITR